MQVPCRPGLPETPRGWEPLCENLRVVPYRGMGLVRRPVTPCPGGPSLPWSCPCECVRSGRTVVPLDLALNPDVAASSPAANQTFLSLSLLICEMEIC